MRRDSLRWSWLRWSWLHLFTPSTAYLLVVAVVITALAKVSILVELDDVGLSGAPWTVAPDLALLMGLASLFSFGEARFRWVLAITIPLTLLVATLSVVDALYLRVTGEQLTWDTISLGLDRLDDVLQIAGEELMRLGWPAWMITALILVGVPLGAWRLTKRVDPSAGWWESSRHRARTAGVLAGVGFLVWLAWPRPASLSAQQVGGNSAIEIYWGWIEDVPVDPSTVEGFVGYPHPRLVHEVEVSRFAASENRPNVLVVVLESTGYSVTPLGGGPTQMPNLVALAARGTNVTRARTTLPHTTKALFSMLCGRLPVMQTDTVEVLAGLVVQCLPNVLRRGGYRTAFFQSALGRFEDRPRLVARLGFEHFEAWEEVRGEPLGYLASDDQSMAPAFASWLDRTAASGRPFFATLLTSSTHHPYRLPKSVQERVAATGAPVATPRDRYARLVESEDALVGELLAILSARGLLDDTIVVLIGDHGEGFGDHGVRQHDTNFYEEGLHVPFVLAGPAVPRGVIDRNASVADLTPTILNLLDIRVAPGAALVLHGHSLYDEPPEEPTPHWFGCWYQWRCRGFVLGNDKVVYIPAEDRAFYFDLAADPEERRALPVPPALSELLPELHRVITSHQAIRWPDERDEVRYGEWLCEPGSKCKHPGSPAGFFEDPQTE